MSQTTSPKISREDRNLFFKLLTNPTAAVTASIVILFALIAIFASWIAPFDPNKPNYDLINSAPSLHHLFGTDDIGRDILSRVMFGTRFSLLGALLCVSIAIVVGCVLGLISGYFGGMWDSIGNWFSNILMALPGLVVLLAAAAILGPNMYLAMGIFGFLLSPAFYRLMYTTVRGVRNELYVDAARVSGLSDFKIITRHVLGVVRAPIIIQAGIIASLAIAIQSGLQFLGLGDPKIPTWGMLLTDGFQRIYDFPLQLLWPALVIGIVTISLVIFVGALRDELERVGARVRSSTADSIASHQKSVSEETTIVHPEPNRKGETLLDISHLEIGYLQGDGQYKVVVHDSNLTINKGEVVGLVGESGSGKTQTALAVLGLLPAGGTILDGNITFDGSDLSALKSKDYDKIRGRKIAYIPQEPMSNLDPSFTIGSQLTEPLRVVLGLDRAAAKARALDLLKKVGLPNPEKTYNSYPHEISGGQAQRVLIAGALSCNPELIIADEPTTALDVTIQAEILDVMRELQEATGVAILIVTHNFGVVADLCDRVAVMQYGRIVESGSINDIFENPEHPYTKELLNSIIDETTPARGQYVEPRGK